VELKSDGYKAIYNFELSMCKAMVAQKRLTGSSTAVEEQQRKCDELL
jgi:hypothetical protein